MMVDYSQWLKAIQPAWPVIPMLLLDFLTAVGFIWGLAQLTLNEHPSVRRKCMGAAGLVVALIAFAAMAVLFAANSPRGESFTEQTERMFGISRLACDQSTSGSKTTDPTGCMPYKLPGDRTPASWMQDGRLVKGTILVNGHKIGLAGADGELLKPAER